MESGSSKVIPPQGSFAVVWFRLTNCEFGFAGDVGRHLSLARLSSAPAARVRSGAHCEHPSARLPQKESIPVSAEKESIARWREGNDPDCKAFWEANMELASFRHAPPAV